MLRQKLASLFSNSDFGLVIDWEFHLANKWVSAYAPFLVAEIVRTFDPVIISSQRHYDFFKRRLRRILSMEPGWAAPRIRFDGRMDSIKAVMYSDPHHEPEQRRRYFDTNGFDYVFSLYRAPFFRHFSDFPVSKFVHFPWGVPDRFISKAPLRARNDQVAIFGGKGSDAYDVRNWCRQQECVTNYEFSGVENKKLSDEDYYLWLRRFDAIVAAGSSLPIYNLVTPKYFEIASSGALLIGQYCDDLDVLGFDDSNAVIFSKEDFIDRVRQYRKNPEGALILREQGRQLIARRHKLSDRIATIREILYGRW